MANVGGKRVAKVIAGVGMTDRAPVGDLGKLTHFG